MTYESTVTAESIACPGVRFTVRRMSFGQRLGLMRQVRDVMQRLEFHAAGDSALDKLEGSILAAELDRIFFAWGAVAVSGLLIDGEEAAVETLFDSGPESLTQEIVEAIKRESSLGQDDAKN